MIITPETTANQRTGQTCAGCSPEGQKKQGEDRLKERCEDPKCPGYGQELTDRGYGYPVCPAMKWYSKRFPGLENKPLAPEYKQKGDETDGEK